MKPLRSLRDSAPFPPFPPVTSVRYAFSNSCIAPVNVSISPIVVYTFGVTRMPCQSNY